MSRDSTVPQLCVHCGDKIVSLGKCLPQEFGDELWRHEGNSSAWCHIYGDPKYTPGQGTMGSPHRPLSELKLSKKQIEALYGARKERAVLETFVHAGVRGALIRKGLIYDRIVNVRGLLGYYLTPEGEAVAALIRKDSNVIPLRRSA